MGGTGRTRRIAVTVAAAVIGASVAACGPSSYDLAAQEREAAEAAAEALDEAPVWIGTVTGHRGLIDDLIVLDYGAKHDAEIDLAHIDWVDSECQHATDRDYDALYTAAIHEAAPVGSTIAVVRAERPSGGYEHDKGFVHAVTADGEADTARVSLNESMVAQGVAMPDPSVALRPESYEQTVEQTVASGRERMSALDFGYWQRFVQAYEEVDARRTGPVGECITTLLAQEAEAERQAREREDEARRQQAEQARQDAAAKAELDDYQRRSDAWMAAIDRWVVGPDGRQGTPDDAVGPYPDSADFGIDTSGGSGGGRSCDGDGDGICYE